MHVGEQHNVNIAESWIISGGKVVGRIVEQTHAGWVLEQGRSIVRTKLARVRTDWGDLHILGEAR
jgi:hypothetical protein